MEVAGAALGGLTPNGPLRKPVLVTTLAAAEGRFPSDGRVRGCSLRLFRRCVWSWGRCWRFSGMDCRGDGSPVVYGSVGINAAALWRINAASVQAAAKARPTPEANSTTRAP